MPRRKPLDAAPAQPNQSLINGIACLELLASSRTPIGSREMARRLDMLHVTVNRLLGTLTMLNLAERTPDRKYRPGPSVHVLAALGLRGSMLLPAAIPRLRPLRDEGLTVALGVLWREHVCYLLHARPPITIEDGIGRHELWPVTQTSLGIALMAGASKEQGQVKEENGARGWVGQESGSKSQLPFVLEAPVENPKRFLKSVRQQGAALLLFPNGEFSVGTVIGRPAYAALGVSGIRSRQHATDLLPRVRRIADEIHEEMNR
jgi:DNA-binding IclR family transcriptional regulator